MGHPPRGLGQPGIEGAGTEPACHRLDQASTERSMRARRSPGCQMPLLSCPQQEVVELMGRQGLLCPNSPRLSPFTGSNTCASGGCWDPLTSCRPEQSLTDPYIPGGSGRGPQAPAPGRTQHTALVPHSEATADVEMGRSIGKVQCGAKLLNPVPHKCHSMTVSVPSLRVLGEEPVRGSGRYGSG